MAGIEVMTVASCVAAVVSAYRDATSLVDRVKAKRLESTAEMPEAPMQELIESLSLGPPVVQGQFDHDVRRFGQSYAHGDQIARECLKDIIINLQMTLLTSLRVALQDDKDLDYEALQMSSDNSRVNAVVCLSQLYLRMASGPPLGSRAQTPGLTWSSGSALSDGRMSYASTASSTMSPVTPSMDWVAQTNPFDRASPPIPPKSYRREHSNGPSPHSSFRRRLFNNPPVGDSSMNGANCFPPVPPNMPIIDDDTHQFHQSAPEALGPREFITKPQFNDLPLNGSADIPRSRGNSTGKEYYGSDETAWKQGERRPHRFQPRPLDIRTLPPKPPPNVPLPPIPPQHQAHRSPPPQPTPSWQPQPQPHHNHHQQQPPNFQTESLTVPQSIQNDEMQSVESHSPATEQRNGWNLFPPGEAPTSAPKRSFLSLLPHRAGSSAKSTTSKTSSTDTTQFSLGTSMSLYLPCEENGFAGFCKGAWKTQLGIKKAMTAESRPVGMYSQMPFWRCSKCCFEGPMAGGRSKAERTYDIRVRLHRPSGIKYRWVFLAKSHVYCKSIQQSTDGSAGAFACIFCCAEQRGPAPAFGNLNSFLSHLQARHQEAQPGPDALMDRTRCIYGRVADNDDDFDLNIPPRIQEAEG